MHLDAERTERLLHGELSPEELAAARKHVDECASCRDRVHRAGREEAEILELLSLLDEGQEQTVLHALPGQGGLSESLDPSSLRPPATFTGNRLWRAAAVLLAVGVAGTASALPGSPIRAWWESLLNQTPTSADAPGSPVVPGLSTRGVSVPPGAALVVDFTSPQPGAVARVTVLDAAEVVVRTTDETAEFSSSEERLVVRAQGTGEVWELEIPTRAPLVVLRVEGREVLRVVEGRVTGAAVEPGPEPGLWNVRLSASGG